MPMTPQPNPRLAAIHEATKTPVSAKTSLSVHPDSLLPFGEPLVAAGGIAESVYENGRRALQRLHVAAVAEREAHDALLTTRQHRSAQGNIIARQEIAPERRPQLHAALTTSWEATARGFDHHLGAVREGIDELSKRIDSVLGDSKKNEVATQTVASEIRKVLREYPPEQRIPMLHNCIKDGDIEVVRAALNCTPFAVGLMKQDQEMLRQMAAEKFAPTEYAARQAGRKVFDAMVRASSLYADAHSKLVPNLKDSKEDAALAKLKESANA